MKKMLFLNGSYNEIPLIKAARELGFYVITSGNDPSGEGHKYANKYCRCDYTDKELILSLAEAEKVDAICSCGNDFAAITASYVCEKLGLPGHDTFRNATLFHEKDGFKTVVKELNLPSPKSVPFSTVEDACRYVQNASFPVIIKPTDLGGGKGIAIAYSISEAERAIDNAFAASKIKHIVVEEYIEGTQHGIVTYIKDRHVVFANFSDDLSYINPYMVWVACRQQIIGSDIQDAIIADINRMAEYCGLADGFLCIQYMMRGNEVFYLETMRRCLGNLHYNAMTRDLSVDFYKLFVATEAGVDTSSILETFHDNKTYSGFAGIYAKENGIISEINVSPWLEERICDRKMLEGPGYEVEDYLHDKLGMVIYTFKSVQEVEYFINNCREMISVNVISK